MISAAQAECATPPPGLELVTARTASNTTGFKEVSAQCPAGKLVTGTGAESVNAYGTAVLDQIEPDPALTRVTAAAHAAQSAPDRELVAARVRGLHQPLSGVSRTALCDRSHPPRFVSR